MLEELKADVQTKVVPLVGAIVQDTQSLLRQEVALVRSEVLQYVAKTSRVLLPAGVGVGLCFSSVILASLGVAHLLNQWMPLWMSYVLVAVSAGIAGWLVIGYGKSILLEGREQKRIDS